MAKLLQMSNFMQEGCGIGMNRLANKCMKKL